MIFLSGGGMVIDTPGMRELQLWNHEEGAAQAFEDIATLSQGCKFRDCGHQGEPGCAVDAAVQQGELSFERLENYRKLLAELRFQERKIESRGGAAGQREMEENPQSHAPTAGTILKITIRARTRTRISSTRRKSSSVSTPTVSYGVSRHVNRDSVLQEAQLFQALAALERRLRKRDEAVQRRLAISIEAEMLEIFRSGAVAVIGNGCAGEIESAARRIRDHLYRAGIVDVGGRGRSHQGSDLHRGVLHDFNQSGDVFRPGHGFVALDVQVNIGCNGL